ncbi:hypothetical protein M0R45_036175 [Rubus argutus]|uniref:Gag-pol polyprotein n=1 Tax=Rubus argutus TaxID=59490 RepID=A0AAW1VZ19_RUBAR
MSNLNKLDFTPLDTTGIGYHKWVRDVRNHLKAKGIISAIREPPAAAAALLPPPPLLPPLGPQQTLHLSKLHRVPLLPVLPLRN